MPSAPRAPRDPLTSPLTFRADLLKDQVVLISGAGSGIGKAIAIQCARLGARLAICGRKPEKLEATATILRNLGADVMVRPATIRDADDVNRLHAEVWERFGRLDHLVNNAGGQFPQAAIDYSVKGWNAVIDTNLNGSWYMMQAAARNWRDRGIPGSIVNIVTVVWRGMPGVAHTCAARAGVIYLSKTLAIEWAPLDIRVNCVAPGAIATEGMDVYSDEARRDMPRSNLMQRFGEATDIADAVTYLIGPSGGFMTGEVVVVDGGNQVWGDQWTIPRPDYFPG
ncbi:SDR family oxidoreductase [Phreatobacter oligotrophus]|jgi:citronellol/citronellal dehydrogenase|uniref:SDR family oxidoreductase n=1 Tax=Phreatobacter oligotrophus TaxID=1122261 RepID=UPI0023554694|nr:SDR family oxidoreductase [Phreatobacter oligotrophus]MBX9990126.1 SDR family oxidoreductase [Phreatobacter oligotrophus]